MKKQSITVWAILLVCGFVTLVEAAPTQWSVADGGNGHYYDVINVPGGIDWNSAKQAAENLTLMGLNGWHLATITSATETSFIYSLCTSAGADSYVLVGGYQDLLASDYSEPGGGWRWITGETWSYTNWHSTEPNNGHENGEHKLALKPPTYGYQWNDLSDDHVYYWYIVESSAEPVEVEMVLIPGGEFEMGDHHDGMTTALPVHTVKLDSFYMGKYEVTNQQYCDYLNVAYPAQIKVVGGVVYATDDSGNSEPYCDTLEFDSDSRISFSSSTFTVVTGKENHPVVEVSWYGAKAFCDYYGYRLPTEAEWEYAARGGEHDPYYRYPWGNSIDGSMANYWNSGDPYEMGGGWPPTTPETTPVGYYDGGQIPSGVDMANGYGLYDMVGNVSEWCNDWYDENYYEVTPYPHVNPIGPVIGTHRVTRGGGWVSPPTSSCIFATRVYVIADIRGNDRGFRVARDVEPCWQEQEKLIASEGAAGDDFGISVSVSSNYAIVGAVYDDTTKGSDSGSAYVFDVTTGSQVGKLTASNGATGDRFGRSVSISGDYAIAGAYFDDNSNGIDAGSAYIFKRDGTNWSEQQMLIASNGAAKDYLGSSVSISGDLAIVGSMGNDEKGTDAGSAYIFKRDGTSWVQQPILTASDATAYAEFGTSVSISGNYAIVGARQESTKGHYSGSAYIFKWNGTSWVEQQKLTASDGDAEDRFGHYVSISGDLAIVGADYDEENGSNSGSAYIFKRDGSVWVEQAKLLPLDGAANDHFGESVSISGDYAIVGASSNDDNGSDSGSAYIFKWDGANWTQQQKLIASDGTAADYFGTSVSISGNLAIVGGRYNDDNGTNSGSAYIFENICEPANTVPLAICKDVTESADGNCEGIVTAEDVDDGSYDPDGDPITLTLEPAGPYPLGETIVTLTVSDGTEQALCQATVTVVDTTAPVITCPVDVTIECDQSFAPSNTGYATAVDNCSSEVGIIFNDHITLGDCADGIMNIITRTWTATDEAGNSSSCDQIITSVDTTKPVISGVPADLTVECDSVPVPATPTASDNCDGNVLVVFDEVRTDGDNDDNYTLTRIWTSTDNCGNTGVATQIITVQDTISPEINLSVEPAVLWPPNHKMVKISSLVSASDSCDADVSITLLSITMDEGDETNTYDPDYDDTQGDGNTTDDIQVDSDGNIYLRAERSGKGDGRVYAIVYEAEDASGNTMQGTATVTVPHSQP